MMNRSFSRFTMAALLALVGLAASIQPALAQDKAAQIDALLAQYHEYGLFNGSALVAANGSVIFKKGYGDANMEWDIPNEPDTKFRLGSITKQFTAVLILQLMQEGKLTLNDPLTLHMPDYPNEGASKVTIHHLLTHTSGIPSYTGLPDFFAEKSRDPYTPEELVDVFDELPLEFEPGSEWRYNNSGYFLLGVIIEKIEGKTYEASLQERILNPLGMDDTGYDHHGTILAKRAAGYERQGTSYINAPYLDMSLPYAAGSLYSTVEDLYTWDRALYTEQVLPPDLKEKMFTPYMNNYGYGWAIGDRTIGETDQTVKRIGHGGGINGFNTIIDRIPEEEHLIVLLNNTGGTSLGAMSQGITNILYGEPADPPKQPIAQVIRAAIDKDGVEAAVAHYRHLKETNPDAYNFAENQLNNLGYQYLRGGDTETAIAIFKLNVEAYPKAFNTYDSLGEAYMEAGDNEKAIANYQKSIELNAGNENGKEMLKKLGVEVENTELVLTAEILDRYLGVYELNPGFKITVTREGTQLKAQATGQPIFDLFPQSETRFYLKVVAAQVEFHVGDDGVAESLTLYQGGQEAKAPRIEEGS